MKKSLFTGISTALVTPFIDGKVNYPMAETLIRRQMDAGVNTIVLSGTTGESPTLSDEEKMTLFQRGKEFVKNDGIIIAGTGSNSTEHAVYLSKEAEKCGVDALLVVSPYYNKATNDGLIAHYIAIAQAVSIPIVIYNVPSRTGVDIPVSVYKSLARIPNIAGVKEASTSISKILKIRSECPEFPIWVGNDDMITPVIALGGQGGISVMSNLVPAEAQLMAQAALAGDFATASALQCQLLPLTELLFCEVNPIPVKAAMKCIGYDCGGCRLPLTKLSAENLDKLQKYLQ